MKKGGSMDEGRKPGTGQDERHRPATRRRRAGTESTVPSRPRGELSDYENLERRSQELEREREAGGPGTSQAPDDETPLLHPKPAKGGTPR
jgi:hypothetical protein